MHHYDSILQRRIALTQSLKASKLMYAAQMEKLQADCEHLEIPGAHSCSLCLKVTNPSYNDWPVNALGTIYEAET